MNRKENNVKIVFAGRYSDCDITSGPEHTSRSIFNEHSLQHHSVFIQYFFDGSKHSFLKKLFGRDEKLLDNGVILTLGIFRIIPELRKHKPDVIHLLTYERFAVIFYLYRMIFSVKIIYNSHGVIQYENNNLKNLRFFYKLKDRFSERVFLKHSDRIIFPSVNTLNIAEKYCDFDDEKAVILPNGIDEIFFKPKVSGGTAKRLKAVIQHKNILNNSGIELLFSALTTAKLPIDIFIISSSDLELPKNEGIKYSIVPIMSRQELAGFYSDKDIFLSLNKYDTFSISTAEAMASGLIPVITSETGISRYIINEVNGYTFPYQFHNELLKILELLTNLPTDKKDELSRSASLAVNDLKWKNVYQMYENIYKGIAS